MPAAYRFNIASGEIRRQRRTVGSVRRADDGLWVGRIGYDHTATARDATTAFREVSARAMGFANLAALRAANSLTRSRNRLRRAGFSARFNGLGQPAFRQPAYTAQPVDPEVLIARLQREAIEVGETPLSADAIRAKWINGGVR